MQLDGLLHSTAALSSRKAHGIQYRRVSGHESRCVLHDTLVSYLVFFQTSETYIILH